MSNNPPPLPPFHIPSLLERYGLHPKKKLGQNFLLVESALQKIVEAAEINDNDLVLEIGPGLGSLTRYLAAKAGWVIAVELDPNLIPPLEEVTEQFTNLTIVQGDILKQDLSKLLAIPVKTFGGTPDESSNAHYAVVANIPYYITSALIRHLLEAEVKPDRIILTVQREVGMRICAPPPEMSLLALSVQVYGQPQVMGVIPAGSFYPTPQVDSAIVRIKLFPTPLIPAPYTEGFFHLAKAGFSQKRKNLRNSLSAGLALPKPDIEALLQKAGIDMHRRAQTLSIEEWKELTYLYQVGRVDR
jgi:16S rRNA (adenine1518-N6/adenine1519-N6)-dimethyltransferase